MKIWSEHEVLMFVFFNSQSAIQGHRNHLLQSIQPQLVNHLRLLSNLIHRLRLHLNLIHILLDLHLHHLHRRRRPITKTIAAKLRQPRSSNVIRSPEIKPLMFESITTRMKKKMNMPEVEAMIMMKKKMITMTEVEAMIMMKVKMKNTMPEEEATMMKMNTMP